MQRIFSLTGVGAMAILVAASSSPAQPDNVKPAAAAPLGVSSSCTAFRDHSEWFPKMAEAGITTVRLFPEWRSFEPKPGVWNWADGDRLVKSAAANKLEINAILMGSALGAKGGHTFPMDNLDTWSKFVAAAVGRYHQQIHYWEVWNEGNGGFNDGHHTTADYAKLAAATYDAAKKADPQVKVGLSVASFDAPYLNQTALAMAKAGTPNRFDFLCIHPYEIADGLGDANGEIPFLWMSRTLRDALKTGAPERADAEIWITEIGRRIEKRGNHNITEQDAARTLAKIYVMAIAQGIARVECEGRDPSGEPPGFGLLDRQGAPRASYAAMKTLTRLLGPAPKYQGWLALGKNGRGYGFVFDGASGPVLAAWMPAKHHGEPLTFPGVATWTSLNGAAEKHPAGQAVELTESPVLITGMPTKLVNEAKANAGRRFPWGGDFSSAKSVSIQPGAPDANHGIFQVHSDQYPTVKFADGSSGMLVQGDIEHPVAFSVHPSFATFPTKQYYVRAAVRRVAGGNVGMNLLYEVADSQGRSPYVNREQWYGATKADGWQTHTWSVSNACFSKMWGYDFTLRPEQSVPFVIGKVEVSTEPFK